MNLAAYRFTIDPQGLTGAAAATYTRKVHEHLRWIERVKTGKILLSGIKYYGRPVTIKPYTVGNCNATATPRVVGGEREGLVSYSPDTFSIHGACSATRSRNNRGLYWDEILFHELVHVFRHVSGKRNRVPLSAGLYNYTSNEEFIAVVVTNIYISDRTNKIKSGLRAGHQGFGALSTDLDESFEFFSSSTLTFGLIETLCQDHPGLSKKIAKDLANTKFNPLFAYYKNREKAKKLSQAAIQRDADGLIAHIQQITDRILNSISPPVR